MSYVKGETTMLSRRLPSLSAFAGTIAVSLWAWVPAASSESLTPAATDVQYLPIQSISYHFGSKLTSGYFVQQDGACFVMLMIAENTGSEEVLALSPTRVRLILYPGEIAGLDSEEGRSLNFTCGEEAKTLLVSEGGRDSLVALQQLMLPQAVASPQKF
jgi:hypothetical protein